MGIPSNVFIGLLAGCRDPKKTGDTYCAYNTDGVPLTLTAPHEPVQDLCWFPLSFARRRVGKLHHMKGEKA